MSKTISEGLIQCRNGVWASASSSSSGSGLTLAQQNLLNALNTIKTVGTYCSSDEKLSIDSSGSVLVCKNNQWTQGISSSAAALVIANNGFKNGGFPNYCTQINGFNGQSFAINHLMPCDTGKVCTALGICEILPVKFLSIDSFVNHNCGILTDGGIVCWGDNDYHTAPFASTASILYPTSIKNSAWKTVSTGYNSSCGVGADDTLWCWGSNSNGQLGNGNPSSTVLSPVQVSGSSYWKVVSVGYGFACGIKTNDTLWCWGVGGNYELGNASATSQYLPVQVYGNGTWKTVSTGQNFSCAIKSDDSMWCWGYNAYGQLGIGNTSTMDRPTSLSIGGNAWKYVSAGTNHTCGVLYNNSIYCWGYNNYGQLGTNNSNNYATPQILQSGGNWLSVSAGGYYTCGIKTDNTLWCWGRNSRGQLGNGNTTDQLSPVQVSGGGTWKFVNASNEHTCGIKIDDTLWCWGKNDYNQIGDGYMQNSSIPVQITKYLP